MHGDPRKRLAWLLLKRRAQLLVSYWPERLHQRDCVGTALADLVSMAQLAWCGATGRPVRPTEVQRRAVVCARRRLQARLPKT